ncbi:MAG: recombinase RecA [Rickettsiales bacterium]|jgi:recombination protein RecA|nr:recombinase RecA [Rickettsiales bacterium]
MAKIASNSGTNNSVVTPVINPEKKKALDVALAQIDKQFGKGSAMKFGQRPIENIQVIPSGSLTIDTALGVGGYPRGRVIEIYGPESSGKTTLTLHAIAEAQKMGLTCAFIDAEHAFDPTYGQALGINLEELIISQPSCGEEGLEIADTLVRSGAVDLIVIDSVAALVPKVELDGAMEDNQMGLQARLMSKALRKLTGSISKTNSTVIFINQIRMKIGVMFGSPETTTGGNALKFYASVRIEIRKTGSIKNKEEIIGNTTVVKVVKNKVAPPFRVANFEICYGEGVSKLSEIVDLGVEYNILEKSGSWYSYNSQRLGQGKENIKEHLRSNPTLATEIEVKIREKLRSTPAKLVVGGDTGEGEAGDVKEE